MKPPLTTLLLLLLAAGSLRAQGKMDDIPTVDHFLPLVSGPVDRMKLQAVDFQRVADLGKRFKAAVDQRPDWMREYAAQHRGQRPLPWHENFGLTREEYQEYYEKSRVKAYVKAGETTLEVKRGERVVEIRFDEGEGAMSPISLDLAALTLDTPLGTLALESKRNTEPDSSPLTPSQYYLWTEDREEGNTRTYIYCTIGRHTGTGRNFIHYVLTRLVDKKPVLDKEAVFFYDPKAPAP
jgi:hypothetical protein